MEVMVAKTNGLLDQTLGVTLNIIINCSPVFVVCVCYS